MTVDGDPRRVKVYLPDPAPGGKMPLVVFLHPAGGSPSEAAADTHFDVSWLDATASSRPFRRPTTGPGTS